MSIETVLTQFRPSVHGWAFGNFGSFGNCGGMCWSALDCFYRRQPVDRAMTSPSPTLKDKISGRQKDTMDNWLWAKVVDWTQRSDQPHVGRLHSVGHLTQEEWPSISELLTHGEPALLCVLREEGYSADPTKNHQVLAWGYDFDTVQRHVSIRVYDPNFPNADKMTLEFDLGQPESNIHGCQRLNGNVLDRRMRGFFLIPYDQDVNVHIHKMNAEGMVGARIDQRTWHKGWTTARFYNVAAKPCLFLQKRSGYGPDDKNVHIHLVNNDGTVGGRDANGSYKWSEGWSSAEFFSIGTTTFLFLLKEGGYDSDGKNVHIHVMNADGTVGSRVPNGTYRWGEGWTTAEFFKSGAQTYLFLLKEKGYDADGKNVHIHAMNADGTVGGRVPKGTYKWGEGWTTAEFYTIGGQTYLFLLKERGYDAEGNNVHIHAMDIDGTVGRRLPNGTYKWKEGWTKAQPYTIGGSHYLFLLKAEDGTVHLHRLRADGAVGDRIKDYNWSAGWTTVEFASLGSGTYLFLLKDSQKADSWIDIPYV